MTNLSAKASLQMTAFADKRGISLGTLERFGVRPGVEYFSDLGRKAEAMVFPYHASTGQEAGWKARTVSGKDWTASKGFSPTLWNLHRAKKSTVIYLTEGEVDALSLVEAGLADHEVAALPNANATECLVDALEDLAGVERFILCMDSDHAGAAARQKAAQILGAGRCEYVDWPEGVKDANEYLVKSDATQLGEFVKRSKPWPVIGLYTLNDLPEPPPIQPWDTGFAGWRDKCHLAPQMLSVVTGHPGHGKTVLMMQVWAQIVKKYEFPMVVASFETRAKPHHRRALRSFESNKPEVAMNEQEKDKADAWIQGRFLWMQHPEERPTFGWILDTAEAAVTRHKARVLLIDPWNKVDDGCPDGVPETKHIGWCLDQLLDFAKTMDVHVQVIAHPAKSDGARRGLPPVLEDIAGSKNWDNRPDQGFVVHRASFENEDGSRNYDSTVYVRKARYEELGHPCTLQMTYDQFTAKFKEKSR